MSKQKSRNAIKSLVKECLIEILAEGLVGNKTATISESRELKGAIYEANERNIQNRSLNRQPAVIESRASEKRKSSYLDSITMGIDNNNQRSRPDNNVKQKVESITNDPVMADIFADTAMTTLREQKEGAGVNPMAITSQGDAAAKVVDQSLPEDLFGGAASKWANLAFAPSIRNS